MGDIMRKITKGIMAAILLPMLLVGCSSGKEEKDFLDKKEEKEQISAFVEVPEKPETLPTATIKIMELWKQSYIRTKHLIQ